MYTGHGQQVPIIIIIIIITTKIHWKKNAFVRHIIQYMNV